MVWEAWDSGADEEYKTSTEECIAQCPIEGPEFEADSMTVHKLIVLYATGKSLKQ